MKINNIKTITLAAVILPLSFGLWGQDQMEDCDGCGPKGPKFEGKRGMMMMEKGHHRDGDKHMRGRMDPARHLLHMSDMIGLSNEQELEIFKISQDYGDQIKAKAEELKPLREALKDLREAKTFNEKTLRKQLGEMHAVTEDLMVLKAKFHNSIQEVLTAEQKTQLEEMREKMKSRFEQKKNKMQKKERMKGQRGGRDFS